MNLKEGCDVAWEEKAAAAASEAEKQRKLAAASIKGGLCKRSGSEPWAAMARPLIHFICRECK